MIEARLVSMSVVDDRSTSRCQLTLIASKCDCLDRVMLLLAFLDSPSILFVLATIGIVDCTFRRLPVVGLHPVPFPFFGAWNGCFTSIWTGWNGKITVFLVATSILHFTQIDHLHARIFYTSLYTNSTMHSTPHYSIQSMEPLKTDLRKLHNVDKRLRARSISYSLLYIATSV